MATSHIVVIALVAAVGVQLVAGACEDIRVCGLDSQLQLVSDGPSLQVVSSPIATQTITQLSGPQLVEVGSSQASEIQIADVDPGVSTIISGNGGLEVASSLGNIVSNGVELASSALGNVLSGGGSQILVEDNGLVGTQTGQIVVSQNEPSLISTSRPSSSILTSSGGQLVLTQNDPIQAASISQLIGNPGVQVLIQDDPLLSSQLLQLAPAQITELRPQIDQVLSSTSVSVLPINLVEKVIGTFVQTTPVCIREASTTCRERLSIRSIIRCGKKWLRSNRNRCL